MTATAPAPLPKSPPRPARVPAHAPAPRSVGGALVVTALMTLPLWLAPGSALLDDATIALAYTVMALGLNIIVGFAGLLDLGYVVFFAVGAYAVGWFASGFFAHVNDGAGIHIAVSEQVAELPGIHVNFLLAVVAAIAITTLAGLLIGLPTLRLRSDYIAIVTLAFGEIIGRIAVNGDDMKLADTPLIGHVLGAQLGEDQVLTGGKMGITPVDKIKLPGLEQFAALDLRPWYWTALAMAVLTGFVASRLRGSRLGRAWVALREDEVAAVAMGIPAVKTKMLAYGIGAAFGGLSGAFLASYHNTVNADQFQVYFSVLILGMVILGGIGTIWGVAIGAVTLTFINFWLIPDVLDGLPRRFGLDFDLTSVSFTVYGALLVLMMLLRPEGLFPERGRAA